MGTEGLPVADAFEPLLPPRRRDRLGAALVGSLGLNAALGWLALQAALFFPLLVWHALAGQFLPDSGLAAYGRQLGWLGLAQAVAGLLTGVLFLAWIRRASDTLVALGVTGLAYSPRQAVAAFLVPGINLVAPLRVVSELWTASAMGESGPGHRTPSVVAWWWGTLLLALLVDLVLIARGGGPGRRLGPGGTPVMVLGEGLRIAAAVLAIAIVLRVNREQGERLARRAPGEDRGG
jgi:hypothetical protein